MLQAKGAHCPAQDSSNGKLTNAVTLEPNSNAIEAIVNINDNSALMLTNI